MNTRLIALCTGTPRPFHGAEQSAIDKRPADGPRDIGRLGVAGDGVADQEHHGGPEMAVHHYPHDHYAMWRDRLGDHALLGRHGSFGENIVAEGLVETGVHIGDRFRIGTALLEVSQPRQPCWKIEHRFASEGMVKHILTTHACGWYYRVIEDGAAQVGATIALVETGHADWSVARVFAALYDPASAEPPEALDALASLAKLRPLWCEKAADRRRS